jgi:thioredoxin-related protein
MRTWLLVLLSLFGGFSVTAAQEIKWMTLDEAIVAQKKEPRKIMMDVYTDWCGPCKLLDKRTFQNKDVVNYVNENYYAVKFNAEGNSKINYKGTTYTNPGYDPGRKGRNANHQFTYLPNISGYPSLVFFDEQADFIVPLTGFLTPQQLELYLKLFSDDTHKKITTKEQFQDYQKEFKPQFKG